MPTVTRRIGLSLGADLCWPLCYEHLVRRLDLSIPLAALQPPRKKGKAKGKGKARGKGGDDAVRFEVERVTIEPFDLAAPPHYDVVLDRLTHWYHTSREWVKKAVLLDGTYVLNNPWAIQSMEKQTTYCAMMRLGLPVPDTWLVPPKEYAPVDDLQPTLERYARLFDLGEIGGRLGYPFYMKPYDGGAWKGVNRIENEEQLTKAYDESGRLVMHLQKAVEPHDLFVRCVGIGPQLRCVRYDPGAPLHDRYTLDRDFLPDADRALLEDMTLTINTFFGWDFNSCEALRRPAGSPGSAPSSMPIVVAPDEDVWHPIDFANACPDSQVTSLHYHFPWLVLSKVRWSLFCAATKRPMHMTLDWAPFMELADELREAPLREKVAAYGALARKRLEAERFAEFCEQHLGALDEIAHDYFAGDDARAAVRLKVAALFPEHEVDEFTELFWQRIQRWRADHEPAAAGAGRSGAAGAGEGSGAAAEAAP